MASKNLLAKRLAADSCIFLSPCYKCRAGFKDGIMHHTAIAISPSETFEQNQLIK